MAIRFEDEKGAEKPAKKQVGEKTSSAERPKSNGSDLHAALPFAKPVRPEKKGKTVRQK